MLSGGFTKGLLELFYIGFNRLSPEMQQAVVDALHGNVRKAAHMFLYAVLAVLIYLFIRTCTIKKGISIVYSLCASLIFSVTDEYHQTFVEGRGGMISDVIIDLSGAFIGIVLLLLSLRLLKIYACTCNQL